MAHNAQDIIIIYHGNCWDGFGGAWAAYKKFGQKADYLPADHRQTVPAPNFKNRIIYLIDFTYSEPVLKKLAANNKKLVILDHHISASRRVKLADESVFDNNHSAAVIAWRYFFPKRPTPLLLRYIEDQDLWKFKMPASKAVNIALRLFDLNFFKWNQLAKDLEKKEFRKELIKKGKLLLKQQDNLINDIVKSAYLVNFAGKKVLAVNTSALFASEAGHQLCQKQPPFSIIWQQTNGTEIKVSLRSNGKFDVSRLAQKYGGGGHKAAAGFTLNKKKFPWKDL